LPDLESISRTPPPSTPLRRPDWFRLAAAPTRLAAANPPSAAACFRTSAGLLGPGRFAPRVTASCGPETRFRRVIRHRPLSRSDPALR
jgi:hypothetical protein